MLREEEGLAFRSLFDLSKALFAKLQWKFRINNAMWSNNIWNKYCKKHMPHNKMKRWISRLDTRD